MKKILAVILFLSVAPSALAVSAIDVSSGDLNTPFTLTCYDPEGNNTTIIAYNGAGSELMDNGNSCPWTGSVNDLAFSNNQTVSPDWNVGYSGVLHIVEIDNNAACLNSGASTCNYTQVQADPGYRGTVDFTVSGANSPESVNNNVSNLISSSSALFASTTGFTLSAAVGWVGDSLIKVFLGSGLAALYALRYWIVALVIISGVVWFSYRAFRFFRH